MRSISGAVVTALIAAAAVVTVPPGQTHVAHASNPDAMFIEGVPTTAQAITSHLTLGAPTVTGTASTASISASGGGHTVGVVLTAPTAGALSVGSFEGADSSPWSTLPKLLITVDAHTCGGGRFDIDEITFDGGGAIASLVVRFQSRCDDTIGEVIGAATWNGSAAYRDRTISASSLTWHGVRFGSVGVSQNVLVTNHGPSPLSIGQSTLSGDSPNDFVVTADGCSNTSLPSLGSCTLTVAFHADDMSAPNSQITAILNLPDDDAPAIGGFQGQAIELFATVTPAVAIAFVDGERNDFITKGTYSHFTGITVGQPAANAVTASFGTTNGFVEFDMPAGTPVHTGTFIHAATARGVNLVVTNKLGCSPIDGYFTIDQWEVSPAGAVNRLVARWKEVCNTNPGNVSWGGVDFNGTVPYHEHVLSTKAMTFDPSRIGDLTRRQTLVIQNPATDSLHVTSATLAGAAASSFTVLANSCTNVTLPSGAACSVSVAAKPAAAGTLSAVLRVVDDVSTIPGTPAGEDVGLTAVGTHDAVRFFLEGEWDDGSVGTQYIQPTATKVSGNSHGITVSGTSGTHTWGVVFHPRKGGVFAPGVYQASTGRVGHETSTVAGLDVVEDGYTCTTSIGTLRIDQVSYTTTGAVSRLVARWGYHCNGGPGASFGGVDLNGTAAFRRAFQTQIQTFEQVTVGTTTLPKEVVVENLGPSTLNTGAVTLIGSAISQFVVVANNCAHRTLAVGAECTIAVAFHPTGSDIGEHRILINVADDTALASHGGTGMNTILMGSSTPPLTSHYGDFTQIAARRVVDTRFGLGVRKGVVGPLGSVSFSVTGAGGVPAVGVSAVVVNVTSMSSTAASWVTLYPTGHIRPRTTNLNPVPGRSVQNQATIAVDSAGKITLYNSAGSSHFVVDVVGFYSNGVGPAGTRFTPWGPNRIYGSRTAVAAKSTTTFLVSPSIKLPSGPVSVVLNVVTVAPTAPGALTMYAHGSTRPLLWSLAVAAHVNTSGTVIVALSANHTIDVYNSAGATIFNVELLGYYVAHAGNSGRYIPVPATRLWDTRSADPQAPSSQWYYLIGGLARVAHDAMAAQVNVTAVRPTATGGLVVFPDDVCVRPIDDNVSFATGVTTAAAVTMALSHAGACYAGDGYLDIFNHAGTTAVVIDVFGYFTP